MVKPSRFSHDKGVKLVKKAPKIHVIVKSHNRKSGAEKGNQAYKKDFYIPEKLSCGGTDAVGDDEIRFPMGEISIDGSSFWIFFRRSDTDMT